MMTSLNHLMWFAIVLMGNTASGKRILIVSVPVISHMNELNAVGAELKTWGHEVYQAVGTHFPGLDKITKTGIEAIFYKGPTGENALDKLNQSLKNVKFWELLQAIVTATTNECHYFMDDKEFLQKVKDMNFDLMLVDGFNIVPCRFILPHHLGVPYVYQCSVHPHWGENIPTLPSFIPVLSLSESNHFSDRMSFLQRVGNFLMMLVKQLTLPPPFLTDTSLLEKYAPGSSWGDLSRGSMLFVVTRDHLLEWPMIGMPNVITTPGITIQPAQPLPADIEQLFHNAEHGVVVISFGSMFGDFKQATIDKLFDGLAKLKQTVIMKFVGDIDVAKKKASPNLHLLKWIPQNDMLGHNKTVAFVTHCGNNGQYEALYHGVPMINMPFFGDQHHNAFAGVDQGYGLQLNFDTLTAQDLFETITEVIENEKYSKKVKHASAILKSDPVLPKAKIAYWIDHVMEYGGDHLRPASMDMSLPVVFCLDVILFLVVIVAIVIYISNRVIKRLCCKSSAKAKKD